MEDLNPNGILKYWRMNRNKPSMEIKVDDLELFPSDDIPAKVHIYVSWKRISRKATCLSELCGPLYTGCVLRITFLGIGTQSAVLVCSCPYVLEHAVLMMENCCLSVRMLAHCMRTFWCGGFLVSVFPQQQLCMTVNLVWCMRRALNGLSECALETMSWTT